MVIDSLVDDLVACGLYKNRLATDITLIIQKDAMFVVWKRLAIPFRNFV